MAPTLWTAAEVARYLQVGVETVWRYTRDGKLSAIKIGKHYRYPINETIESLRNVDPSRDSPRPGQRMTLEEFNNLPEQAGLQLIDGRVVKEPSPRYGHQAFIGALFVEMATYVKERGLGQVILAPFDIVLARDQVVQPDVIFVSKNRGDLIKETGLYGAPDIAVEVLSPSTRRYDEGRKREIYFEHGSLELWIVDTDEQSILHAVRGDSDWVERLLHADEALVSQALQGFQVGLGSLF